MRLSHVPKPSRPLLLGAGAGRLDSALTPMMAGTRPAARPVRGWRPPLRQSIFRSPWESLGLLLEPFRAGIQVPGDALDGGRLVTGGNRGHEFVVALVRQAVEASPTLLALSLIHI